MTMAAKELDDAENAHLRSLMLSDMAQKRFASWNKLAKALDIEGSSIHSFVKRGGGASKVTAKKYAEITGRTLDEVLGRDTTRRTPMQPIVAGRAAPVAAAEFYRPTAKALEGARVFLQQSPQPFSDRAIELAVEELCFATLEEASRPSNVAQAIRQTIQGVAHLPFHPSPPVVVPPSGAPPAGTRRSKSRGR